jgi:hypothetical protein
MNPVDPSLLRDFIDSYLPEYLNKYEKNKPAILDIAYMLCSSGDIIGYWTRPTPYCFMQNVMFWDDELYKAMGVWMADEVGMCIEDFESIVNTWDSVFTWHTLFEWASVPTGGRSIWSRTGTDFPLSRRSEAILDYIMDDIFGESPHYRDFFRKLCRRIQIREILECSTPLYMDVVSKIIESV